MQQRLTPPRKGMKGPNLLIVSELHLWKWLISFSQGCQTEVLHSWCLRVKWLSSFGNMIRTPHTWYQHLVPTPCTPLYHLQNLSTSQKRESGLWQSFPLAHEHDDHEEWNRTSQKHADLSSKPLMQRPSSHYPWNAVHPSGEEENIFNYKERALDGTWKGTLQKEWHLGSNIQSIILLDYVVILNALRLMKYIPR